MTKEVNKQRRQQQLTKTKSTKKCHGNQRLQYFKRKCRSKGMKIQKTNRLVQQDNQQIHAEEEKMAFPTTNADRDINVSTLLENKGQSNTRYCMKVDLTISSSTLLEPKATGEWVSPPIRTQQKRIKSHRILSTDHWKQTSRLLPNYIQLSPHLFKDMLSKAIPCYHHQIEQYLSDNTEILQFIQQRAELSCTVFQLKIEQDYWNFVANLIMPVVNWLSEKTFDDSVLKRNSINWDHTKTKMNIKHRQNIIENKLEQTENNLNFQLQQQQQQPQPHSSSLNIQNKKYLENSMNITFHALAVLIRNDLHSFLINFHRRKILLNFDVHAIHLVKSFYDLNPTEKQIRFVQQIWQSKLKSCKRAIRQQKKHSLIIKQTTNEVLISDDRSPSNNEKNEFYYDCDHQEDQLSSTEPLTPIMHLIIKARLDNIEQRTYQILEFINVNTR